MTHLKAFIVCFSVVILISVVFITSNSLALSSFIAAADLTLQNLPLKVSFTCLFKIAIKSTNSGFDVLRLSAAFP